jgi:hypothetical protein
MIIRLKLEPEDAARFLVFKENCERQIGKTVTHDDAVNGIVAAFLHTWAMAPENRVTVKKDLFE